MIFLEQQELEMEEKTMANIDKIVEEVYNLLIEDKHKDKFISEKKVNLIGYHHSLGAYIRNEYHLWDNKWEPEICPKTNCDISPNHPDQISMTIIEKVWEKANEEISLDKK